MMPNKPLHASASPASSSLGESLLQYQEHKNNVMTNAENSFVPHQQQNVGNVVNSEDDDVPYNMLRYASMQASAAPNLSRSSPIAIVRSPGRGGKQKMEENDVDDDDDEDGGVKIDVEGDALKLRRKYGETNIVRTYHQESTIPLTTTGSNTRDPSILNAPYLGSLSKSANQVLSLPPMSLTDGEDAYYRYEPPESIVSYGSLRDSHERGRFLDGPSSYREPTSGRIRQLDHRLRYHGRTQPELSIGERMQRSIRLKGQAGKQSGYTATLGELSGGKQPTTSSLSAMMDEASKTAESVTPGSEGGDAWSHESGLETWTPVVTTVLDHSSLQEHQDEQMMLSEAPSVMLSTSLTAFEVLKTSNTYRSNISSTYASQSSSTFAPTGKPNATTSNHSNIRPQGFQPLGRSMSDPTPQFSQLALSENGRNANTAPITAGQAPMLTGNLTANAAAAFPTSRYGFAQPSLVGSQTQTDHDPETEGAFGDMDME